MKISTKHRRHRGFSLVELLVVIAILGVIAAIAVVNLSNTDENSRITAAKAQAQRIASTFSAGEATGAPGFTAATSVNTAIDAVATGSYGAGATQSTFFQLAGVSSTMDDGKPLAQQAKHYLSWQNGMLIYDPSGGAVPEAHDWEYVTSYSSNAVALDVVAWWRAEGFFPEFEFRVEGANISRRRIA